MADSTRRVRAFAWARGCGHHARLSGLLADGIVPVVEPAHEESRARWGGVLRWYGLDEVSCEEPAAAASRPGDGGDLVVAVGPGCAAAFRPFAEHLGRALAVVEDLGGVFEAASRTGTRSVLLACPAPLARLHTLELLRRRLAAPCGILPVRDFPTATFVVAKLLAARDSRPGPSALLDAVAGVVRTSRPGGPLSAPEPLTPGAARGVLDGDWRSLAVLAHGEGGHINLVHAVLCGVFGEDERVEGGAPTGGCAGGAIRRCKRVPGAARTPISSFSDLRTVRLALLSCTSGAVAAEPYPSNVSGVMSAFDGHAASVVATDRVAFMSADEGELTIDLFRQEVDLAGVTSTLNEVQARRAGHAPYVLFGDPRAESGPKARTTPGDALTAIRLEPGADGEVIGIERAAAGVRLIRGSGRVFVLGDGESRRHRVVDKGPQSSAVEGVTRELLRRSARAAWLERAITRVYAADSAESDSFARLLEALDGHRRRLEQHAHAAFESLAWARASGVWDNAAGVHCARGVAEAGGWDRAMATLIADHLLRGDVFEALANGLVAVPGRCAAPCDRCGTPLVETRLAGAGESQPDWLWVACPLCGDRDIGRTGGTPIGLGAPEPLVAGRPGRVVVELAVPRDDDLSRALGRGQLIVQAFDKGAREVFFRHLEAVAEPVARRELAVEVPSTLTPDLHYLWAGWVAGLDVSVHRRRWLTIPLDDTSRVG